MFRPRAGRLALSFALIAALLPGFPPAVVDTHSGLGGGKSSVRNDVPYLDGATLVSAGEPGVDLVPRVKGDKAVITGRPATGVLLDWLLAISGATVLKPLAGVLCGGVVRAPPLPFSA